MNIIPEQLFSALSHGVRLRALLLLHPQRELCVCELTQMLGVAQPTVSRHLAQLREAGLVDDRRDGLWVYYRLHPQLPEWVRNIIAESAHGLATRPPFAADRDALDALAERSGLRCAS